MKLLIKILAFLFLSMFTLSSSAGILTTCSSLEDIHLTSMQPVSGGSVINFGTTVSATDCIEDLLGNDMPLPKTNIGQYKDGLFNGQSPQKKGNGNVEPLLAPVNKLFDPFYQEYDENNVLINDQDDDGYNDYLEFISPPESLKDIGDVGGITSDGLNDPGWVYLGRDEGNGFDYASVGNGLFDENHDSMTIALSSILNIDFSCTDSNNVITNITSKSCENGFWSIMPDVNIEVELFDLFGDGFFDQLAFVFKGGNDGFSIYNFDFNEINEDLGGGLDLEVPYNLTGTFNGGILGNDISHISLYAHDPVPSDDGVTTTSVPEPKTILIFLFGMIMILFGSKIKA